MTIAWGCVVESGSFEGFPDGLVGFLEGLKAHNDKVWFEAHRTDYDAFYLRPGRAFAADLAGRLTQVGALGDGILVEGSPFRIFRDTRFGKDKSPYKTHFGVSFGPQGQARHEGAGFYFHMEPPRIGLGAGMHAFSKPVLEAYRTALGDPQIAGSARSLISGAEAQGASFWGKTYKKTPPGYTVAPGDEDLLLYSGFFAWLDLDIPPALHSADFLDFCLERYVALAPVPQWVARLSGER